MVVRAVDAMLTGGVTRVVVVAPKQHLDDFRALFAQRLAQVKVVVGGAERQDSVRLGLEAASGPGIVLVHDAARPLVPDHVVEAVIRAVGDGATAVVPAMPVVDTIRQVTEEAAGVIDRSQLRAVQTPQGFDAEVLRRAHEFVAAEGMAVTDDASACEALGERVTLVPGDREALKITEPFDLIVAEAIVASRE